MRVKNNLLAIILLGVFAPAVSFGADFDEDGLSDEQEARFQTSFRHSDTDGDGFSDLEEVQNGFSPLFVNGKKMDMLDSDGDGLFDVYENWFLSQNDSIDTDGDGFSDYDEVMFGFSPIITGTTTQFSRKVIVDRTIQKMKYMVDGLPIKEFDVSTGNPRTPTPSGDFFVRKMVPVMRYAGRDYDFKGVKWNMEFFPRYYLHTAYWHNDFGKRTRSHGCVNMKEKDAAILYKYMSVGFSVSIIGETPKRLFVGT